MPAWAHLGSPQDLAGRAIERPEHTALLAGAQKVARFAASLGLEQKGALAEIEITAARLGAGFESGSFRKQLAFQVSKGTTPSPFDRAGREVECDN